MSVLADAAHTMTPHMGQGANMSLEDVCELVEEIVPALRCSSSTHESFDSSITAALQRFCHTPRARIVCSRIPLTNKVPRYLLNAASTRSRSKIDCMVGNQATPERWHDADYSARCHEHISRDIHLILFLAADIWELDC